MTTQPVPKTRLLVLDNAKIQTMLARPEIVREFQFMSGMAAKVAELNSAKCPPCSRKNRANQLDFEGVKTAIGQMAPLLQQRLKELLNAEQVRLVYKNVRGQTVRATF